MNFLLRFSLLFIFYSFIITIINIEFVQSNDVIELIGYNYRQSKMQKYPIYDNQHQTQPMKKQRADIETVKQNIDEYNKLLKIDTKKLSLQQKDMLERIVERVARLKETLDINDGTIKQSTIITTSTDNTTPIITAKPSTSFSSSTLNDNLSSTDSININQNDDNNNDDIINSSIKYITDETTYLPPQTTDNIYITTTQQTTLSGGRSALTTTYQQSEEARANLNNLNKNNLNNINLSTISSNSRSSSSSSVTGGINKSKIRHSTTKKPMSSSSTKPTSKRIISTSSSSTNNNNGHHSRPSMKPTFSTNSPVIVPALISLTTTTQQSNIGEFSTTIQPLQNKQINYNKQDIISTTDHNDDLEIDEKTVSSIIIDHHLPPPAVQIQERTPIGGNGGIISSDLIYDSNVTATSIIDSLSNHAREDYYNNNKGSLADNIKDKKPAGGTAKPTKYHYYPHNQHIYLLPECAIQQVCNAVYVRLNYTQPLCACPSRYRDPCSASLNEDDQHTTKLVGDGKKKAITLAKTCEATTEMRECRSPKDWSLLALQNTRTGKSHYLVICRCPDHFKLEGPMAHDQPTYASVPGIRVFGMMCVKPGYSIRKPSVQPPKRYQLQKPYYISNSQHNKYNINKDNQRPSSLSSLNSQTSNNGYQQQQQLPSNGGYQNNNQQHDSYQLQNQANYQYLNRPESSPIITSVSHTEYPDTIGINSFSTNSVSISSANSGYGRNNEKINGENPIEADDDNVDEDNTNLNNDNDEKKRTKRSTKINIDDNNIPEFPWDKLVEFQQSVVWDE